MKVCCYYHDRKIINVNSSVPDNFILYQNYPNPFNPSTNIKIDVPVHQGSISLKIYNLTGRLIQTLFKGSLNPGTYSYQFNSNNLPSGVYFYKLVSDGYSETKKMVFIK